jgi:predicted ribosomally synthesized peptide with SipW-like signal peptide
MTRNEIELTRRRILTSLGAVGIASAGAGLGTTAYFSDGEDFEGNALVAGELDLQMDWEEHYSDWSTDENDDRTDDFGGDESDTDGDGDGIDDFEVVMTDGDPSAVPEGYVGFPTFEEPLIAVPGAFMDDFLDNTAVEAYPDQDGDGIQDMILTRDQIASQQPALSPDEVEVAFHDQFADVPDDLEAPVIELADVKPGDFGEVTFSTHLHNNPGYLWMTGDLLAASENGTTEPERNDPDETEGVVELLDEIRVAIWYDDGDNVREPEEMIRSPHDVDAGSNITLDASDSLIATGSLREILARLSTGDGLPLDADPRSGDRDCYPFSSTYYFGFAWWLPVDHANEIQTDSVEFDLGFYTEQCRHNPGTTRIELPARENYIGYEDRPESGDFDYNDFGMDGDIRESYADGDLESAEMEFTSRIYQAGDDHQIHIQRTFDSSVEYDYTLSRDHTATGSETPAGNGSGSGDFDVTLFDTGELPGKTSSLDDRVEIDLTVTSGSVSPPTSAPRPDVAAHNPLFAVYDPYLQNTSTGTRIDLSTVQDNVDKVEQDWEAVADVPNIIVVPRTGFVPPGENETITADYPTFDDYYADENADPGDSDGDIEVNPAFEDWFQ